MQKMPHTTWIGLIIGLSVLGVLGIPGLVNDQFIYEWGYFVVNMPILAGLILPSFLLLCALLYQNGLIPDAVLPENRVLLIRNDTILSEGLVSILMQQTNLVVSTIVAGNTDVLLDKIDGFQPNTIVLPDQESHGIFVQLLDLLDQYPNLRLIIRIGIENDQVETYEKNQVSIQNIEDFASVLNGNKSGLESRNYVLTTPSRPTGLFRKE